MKKICLFSLCLLLSLPGFAFSQDIKIGVVNLQKVLEESEPGQKALKKLESEYEEMRSELDSKKQAIDQMRKKIQEQSLVLSQEAESNKKSELNKKMRNFQSLYQRYNQKIRKKEQELKQPIIKKIVDIIDKYGKNNNYTLILDKQNSGVVYNMDTLEITQEILSRLNKKYESSE